jgi:hypothetical protein
MSNKLALVKLGQFMMQSASNFKCDVTFNKWARVGQALTELDRIFAPQLREFPVEDQLVVKSAAAVMMGKLEMPDMLVPRESIPRRTRRARMTRVMSKKEPKAAKPTLSQDSVAPRKRGRPRKVVAA